MSQENRNAIPAINCTPMLKDTVGIGMQVYLPPLEVISYEFNVHSHGSQLTELSGDVVIAQCMKARIPFTVPVLLASRHHHRCTTHWQPNALYCNVILLNLLIFVYSIFRVYNCKFTLFTKKIVFIYFL